MKIYFLVLLIIISFISCNQNSDYIANYQAESSLKTAEEYIDGSDDEMSASSKTEKYKENIPVVEAKIIKTGNVSIKVDNYTEEIKNIKNIISKFNGRIISEKENSYSYGISNDIQISIKNNLFDSLINTITKNQNVLSKEITAQDVTEEYIDVTSRIESKKLIRDRYKDLLKQAKTINEILNVEDKLRVIQEEIEAKQGRLNYLKIKTKYSTINLTVTQEDSNIYEPDFFSKIAKGFESGWNGLKIFFLILIYLWPLWLILVGIFIWLKYYLKKRKARKLKK